MNKKIGLVESYTPLHFYADRQVLLSNWARIGLYRKFVNDKDINMIRD
jgi:hypothetical protein